MRRFVVFGVVGLSLLFTSISSTVVIVAFPAIIDDFNSSLIVASWVLGVNQLAATSGMPLAGKACDVLGRKFVFILCVFLFTGGSLLSAIAPNIELLIFFRFLQGLGMGGFLPVATAVVAEEFPNSRQQSIGIFSSIFPIGQIIGPNLGAWLTTAFGWRSTFWFCVPLGLLVLIISLIILKKSPGKERHLDLMGGGIFTAMVVAVMSGISFMGSSQGATPWVIVGVLFAAGAGLLVYFLRRQSRVSDPIIDVRVLRERAFMASNAFNFLYGFCVLGIFSFIPLYAVTVYNMSTLESGLILTPRSIAVIIASLVTSFYLVRWGYRKPMMIGTVIISAGLFLLAVESHGLDLFGWQLGEVAAISLILFLAGLGIGAVAPAANNACIELMPDRVGTITGVRGMFRQVGGAISVSITALILHIVGDMGRGFYFIFIWFAVILLLSLPLILMVPRSPGVVLSDEKSRAV